MSYYLERPTEATSPLAERLTPAVTLHLRRTDVHTLLDALAPDPNHKIDQGNRVELIRTLAPLAYGEDYGMTEYLVGLVTS
jgi:hypothetical protein